MKQVLRLLETHVDHSVSRLKFPKHVFIMRLEFETNHEYDIIETKIYGYHMRGLSDELKLAQVWVVYQIEQSVYIIKNAHGRTVMDLKKCTHARPILARTRA